VFATAYDGYLRKELAFTANPDRIFYMTSGGVGAFTSTGNDDAAVAAALARNPDMKVFVAVNYFDLSAPFYAVEYTVAHWNVSPEARGKNIAVSHLEAGEMPYLDSKAAARLHEGLAGWVK
jgi:carboxypeptidase C (cathepsin A)